MDLNNSWFFKKSILTNTCMALIINTAATVLAGGDTLSGWVQGCCCAFTINTIAAALIPVGPIAAAFAGSVLRTEPGTVADLLARNLAVNFIFVTIVSFGMALIHTGVGPALIPSWFSTWFQLLIVGIVGASVLEKPLEAFIRYFSRPENRQTHKRSADTIQRHEIINLTEQERRINENN